MKKIEINNNKYEDNDTGVISPYTGNCVTGEDGEVIEDDKSILFVYVGMANEYAYISNEFRELIDKDIETIEIEDLESKLNHIEGTLLEVDYGWGGVNYYGFIDPNQ